MDGLKEKEWQAYLLFASRAGEDYARYATPTVESENHQRLRDFIRTSGMAEDAATNEGAFQIAFRVMRERNELVADPDYISPAFVERVKKMSADELKRAIRKEAGFAETYAKLTGEVL